MKTQLLTEITVPGTKSLKKMEAYYFDTPTGHLQKEKLAYRIRREGEQWVATVKGGGSSHGGLHERQEWNISVSDAQPDIHVFATTEIGKKLLAAVDDEALIPILITRFERTKLDVIMPDGSQIEVAADQGTIVAGEKTAPILEIELELKSGQPASVIKLGAMLGKEHPLVPESDSKFYRGLKLAGLAADPSEEKEPPREVHKHMKSSEGLCFSLVQAILQVMDAQKKLLENEIQPEDLHELRIALRRLRSLLDFSKNLFTEEEYQQHQSELREFGQDLGKLRDIDVAYEKWQQCYKIFGGKDGLSEVLLKQRLREANEVHKVLCSGQPSSLLLALWADLLTQEAQKKANDHITLEEYANNRLAEWIKGVTKQSVNIDWTNAGIVHKIRLQVKKIKYAVQALQPVFGEMPQFILRLDTLQVKLGLLTDYTAVDTVLTNLLKPNSSKALYLEMGMMLGWQECEKRILQSKMDKSWGKFYRTAQRWAWSK